MSLLGNGLKSWVLSEEERGAAHEEEGGEDIIMEAQKTKPGTRFDKTNGGNCRGTETQIFLEEYRQQIFEVVV